MPTHVEEHRATSAPAQPIRRRKTLYIVAVVLLVLLVVGTIVGIHEWPFTRAAVILSLQQQSAASVNIGRFHNTFFPPGCVAEEVTFRRQNDAPDTPYLTIQKLTIIATYAGMLHNHVSTIRAEGLHLTLGAATSSSSGSAPMGNIGKVHSGLTIGQIVADGAQLDVRTAEPRATPLIFKINKLALRNLSDSGPLSFDSVVDLPEPPSEVAVTGKFGPLQTGNAGQTKLSGSYTVRNMNLLAFGGVAGTLSGEGSFKGVLEQVGVQGTADVPQFQVKGSTHRVHLVSEYQAQVNGLNGDVMLQGVRVHFGKTTVTGSGSVVKDDQNHGKVASFQLYSQQARIEDLFDLFIKSPTSPIVGPVIFSTKIRIPPEHRSFLDKTQLEGDFGIKGAKYPNADTQKTIDELSAKARGKADQVEDAIEKLGEAAYDPGRVLTNLKGHVTMRNAVANFSNVSFDVPGAAARVQGTYNLDSERVNLRGMMKLDTELSKATTGVKSVLMKVIEPFMHKSKSNGSIVAIRIGGTYDKPKYGVTPVAEKK